MQIKWVFCVQILKNGIISDKKETLSADILGKILMEFSDSTFPYEVDVIDLNAIDEKFKSLIKNSLVELF